MLNYELYDNVSDTNRQYIVAVESAEIALDRSLLALDVIMESQELQIREAELKCFEESGDALNLMDYYEDAKENTEEKKKGILATIWDKIVEFFRKITGKSEKLDENSQYATDSAIKQKVKKIGEGVNAVLAFITHPIRTVFTKGIETWKKIVSAIELITVGVATFAMGKWVIKKITKKSADDAGTETTTAAETMNGAEANKIISTLKGWAEKLHGGLDKNKDSVEKEAGEENKGFFAKLLQKIGDAIKSVISTILRSPKTDGAAPENAAPAEKDAKAGKKLGKFGKKNEKDSQVDVKEESAEDPLMTKDYADLLASEAYTESADEDDMQEMLKDLI